MLKITNYQINSDQNHNNISPISLGLLPFFKKFNLGKDERNWNPVNSCCDYKWSNHHGKQKGEKADIIEWL
jgi:hypothetical protein